MDKLTFLLAVSVALAATLNVYGKSRADATDEVKAQLSRLAAHSASDAGLVTRPAQGRFAIVSSQVAIPTSIVEVVAKKIAKQFKFPVECLFNDVGAEVDSVRMRMRDDDLAVGIFLLESDSLPMSLVSMEERWAIVNMSRVDGRNTSIPDKEHRLRKELSRVCKALFSGVNPELNARAVRTGDDLQSMTTEPIDSNTLMAIVRGMPSYGLVAPRIVPYYRACREGWAPAPTNEVQKTIWEKVHAVPDKPITIEFDPKTGR